MITLIEALCIVLIILIFYVSCNKSYEYMTVKKCASDKSGGSCFSVQKQFDENSQQQAAELLSQINEKNKILIEYLTKKYKKNGSRDLIVKTLKKNYDVKAIKEHNPKDTTNTSYVYQKGKEVAFCLREKITGNNYLHDFDTMYFVNLHEISHLAMPNYDSSHSAAFWSVFKFILQEAEMADIFQPINYKINPINYCGLIIDYNPYYDKLVKNI
jgi:hypothetical protein